MSREPMPPPGDPDKYRMPMCSPANQIKPTPLPPPPPKEQTVKRRNLLASIIAGPISMISMQKSKKREDRIGDRVLFGGHRAVIHSLRIDGLVGLNFVDRDDQKFVIHVKQDDTTLVRLEGW